MIMDRQYILDEIRRTARPNNREPLGKRTFEKETGIKESDWLGKIWVRWSDAVREAGFEPNQLQVAYRDDVLLRKTIDLIRELGHFPVKGEFLLKARDDPGFPSHNTFRRFGSKAQFVSTIFKYCRQNDSYDDVIQLCAGTNVSNDVPLREDRPSLETEQMGFVYLLKSGQYFKIGRTNAGGRRERELQIQWPEKAESVHVIRTDYPLGIEAYWHGRFKAKRKHGEWFELTRSDIQAFRRRKFM
jgi:hypothetical protein